jgi:uncharacterized protein YbaR (Trm112 family)
MRRHFEKSLAPCRLLLRYYDLPGCFAEGSRVVRTSHTESFNCPNCKSHYKLVRAEADPESLEGQVACRQCGASFNGREGHLVLKYFLVDKPRQQGRVLRVR